MTSQMNKPKGQKIEKSWKIMRSIQLSNITEDATIVRGTHRSMKHLEALI